MFHWHCNKESEVFVVCTIYNTPCKIIHTDSWLWQMFHHKCNCKSCNLLFWNIGTKNISKLSNWFESSVEPFSCSYWFCWITRDSLRHPLHCNFWVSEVFQHNPSAYLIMSKTLLLCPLPIVKSLNWKLFDHAFKSNTFYDVVKFKKCDYQEVVPISIF